MKTKSAITGKFVSAKAAKAKPRTTYTADDYPARQLRKIVRMLSEAGDDEGSFSDEAAFILVNPKITNIIANIKKKMGWK